MQHAKTQQHLIGLYLKIWLLLFVLSAFSYMVDYFQLEGLLRWSLIVLFMTLKAGLIMTVFMHFAWERRTLKLLFFVPLFAIVVLITLMTVDADHTFFIRTL